MELNYYRTLIAVADDCPVSQGTVPTKPGTVAALQYAMLAGSPQVYTQEDVLFQSWLRRQHFATPPDDAQQAELRRAFFARPQACLRASPLPKQYGWGLLFDEQGRVALCPMESQRYRQLVAGQSAGQSDGVRIVKAMRSRRA
jgi:hypothetical protein